MEKSPIQSPTEKSNFLLRLFRGDISLPVTYWVFGSLIGSFAFGILLLVLEYNYFVVSTSESGALLLRGFYWLAIAYSVFILVAIWRSAGKYQGRAIWAGLARVAVVLGGLSLIVNLVGGFQVGSNTDAVLEEQLRMLNASLPVMLDDDTRLNHISVHNDDFYFDYTLVNVLSNDVDIDRFNNVMTAKLKTDACESSDTRPFLEEGRNLVYMYRDNQSNPVSRIVVSKSDCI